MGEVAYFGVFRGVEWDVVKSVVDIPEIDES